MEWYYSDDKKQIVIDKELKQFKYLTGTRLASCLGLNPYSSPFQCWAECTKLVTPPYEDTIYTIAGKTIEPKQRAYVAKKFPNVKGPEEYFGNIYEMVKWNFFSEQDKPFAGLWDAVCTKANGKDITLVIEFKTANNAAKWLNSEPPIYYQLQGALYAKLLGLDKVLFVASFLDKLDYANPQDFEPNETNTIMIVKRINEMVFEINGVYLSFDECLERAKDFWENHVKTGISPEFNEKLDKEYLDIIRKSAPAKDNDLTTLCIEAITLAKEIKELEISSGLKNKNDELKILEKAIKETMLEKEIEICDRYTLKRSTKLVLDEKILEDKYKKIYEECCVPKTTFTLNKNLKEESNEN